ncbi:MAG: glycosyltransferase [Myxococcales bacterium]|nr:glycosyltransferase [Myxococcales bacterium]
MKTRPDVSVVTPSYNQADFIEDAIQSVLGQTGATFEHIVVDALSDDGTAERLAKHPHLRVVREADRGQSDALNKGFALARAPIVCWLNADDYLLPNAFSEARRQFQTHPDAAAIFGHYYLVDSQRRLIRSKRVPPFDASVCRHFGVCAPTSGSFFAADVLRDSRFRLDEDLSITMDWDLYQRLADAGLRLVQVPKFLSAFRIHEGNKSIGEADVDRPERRRLEERRLAERDQFQKRYVSGRESRLHRLHPNLPYHVHHIRFVLNKAARLYYLRNALDRLRTSLVLPAGAA